MRFASIRYKSTFTVRKNLFLLEHAYVDRAHTLTLKVRATSVVGHDRSRDAYGIVCARGQLPAVKHNRREHATEILLLGRETEACLDGFDQSQN